MTKRLYSITVKGDKHLWGFNCWLDPQYLDEWLEDGLEITEIHNTIPMWVVEMGMMKPWCFMQDLFNFRFKHLAGYFRRR